MLFSKNEMYADLFNKKNYKIGETYNMSKQMVNYKNLEGMTKQQAIDIVFEAAKKFLPTIKRNYAIAHVQSLEDLGLLKFKYVVPEDFEIVVDDFDDFVRTREIINDAIDKCGGQTCDIKGVLRELNKAGFKIVKK